VKSVNSKANLKDFYEGRIWKFHSGMELYEKIRLESLFEFLEPNPNEVFLDAGCGGGFYTRYLAKVTTVIAADISRRGLKSAKEELGETSRIHFIVCDTEALPIKDGAIDKIINIDTLEHIANVEAFLREASRVTKSKGKISLFTACGRNRLTLEYILKPLPVLGQFIEKIRAKFGHINIFTTQQLHELMEPNFTVVKIRYMHHWLGWLFKFLWDIKNINLTEDCSKLPELNKGVIATLSQVLWQTLEIEYNIFKKTSSGTEINVNACKR
jgi:ubiquinone/menaquinone biosynthesis C-methylase UbiE